MKTSEKKKEFKTTLTKEEARYLYEFIGSYLDEEHHEENDEIVTIFTLEDRFCICDAEYPEEGSVVIQGANWPEDEADQ